MLTAIIDEAECIGCSRCIPACPIDSIVGAFGHQHTVLADECIGCKLCLAPCPVDCITIEPVKGNSDKKARGLQAKKRHLARQQRLQQESQLQLPVFACAQERTAMIKNDIEAILQRSQDGIKGKN